MMMRRAQTTLEYVFLIGIVAAALIAILAYVSRGFQGKLRNQADEMGEQYSPGHTDIDITETTNTYIESHTGKEAGTGKKFSTSRTVEPTKMTIRDASGAHPGHENIEMNLDQERY
ncbi:MAG: hypothetical protein AAB089_04440 [Nitrospirota bacterium]